jgi:hypothetical protein
MRPSRRGGGAARVEYFDRKGYYTSIKYRFGSPTVPAGILYFGIELVFDLFRKFDLAAHFGGENLRPERTILCKPAL